MISGLVTAVVVFFTKGGFQVFSRGQVEEAFNFFGSKHNVSHMLLNLESVRLGERETLEIRLDRIITDVTVVFTGSDGRPPTLRFSAQQAGEAFCLFGTHPGVLHMLFSFRKDDGKEQPLILRYGEDGMQAIEESLPPVRRRRQPAQRSRSWWSLW